jgi:hypothetical protein
MTKMKNAYRTSVAKPEAKRLLGKPRHRCQDVTMNFNFGFREERGLCCVAEQLTVS